MSKDTIYREDSIKAEVPERVQIIRKEIERLCENCERPTEEEMKERALESMVFGFSVGLAADRPKGEWVLQDNKHHIEKTYLCSNCENFQAWGESEKYNYCPNCGARMKGAENDTN